VVCNRMLSLRYLTRRYLRGIISETKKPPWRAVCSKVCRVGALNTKVTGSFAGTATKFVTSVYLPIAEHSSRSRTFCPMDPISKFPHLVLLPLASAFSGDTPCTLIWIQDDSGSGRCAEVVGIKGEGAYQQPTACSRQTN